MKMQLAIAIVTISFGITPANAAGTVSYERQIAPLLASHCSICHGAPGYLFEKQESGAPNTMSYAALRKEGATLVVPYAPERSRILRKPSADAIKLCADLEAREITRGPVAADDPATFRARAACVEVHHPTLPATGAAIVTKWIEEGAPFDAEPLPKNCVPIRGTPVPNGNLSLYFKPLDPGLVTVRVADVKSGESLLTLSKNVNAQKYPSAGAPDNFYFTDLPKLIDLNFCQPYTAMPFGLVLGLGLSRQDDLDMASVDPPVLDPEEWSDVTFTTWQQRPSDAKLEIIAAGSKESVFAQAGIKLTAGLNRFVWNRMTSKSGAVKPGAYMAYLTIDAPNSTIAFSFQLNEEKASPTP